MILQALAKLYDDLLQNGSIARPSWAKVKAGYAVCLDENGTLIQIITQVAETQRAGKTVTADQTFDLPAPVKRSSGILPNFLWDNSSYVFGVDDKGKPDRSVQCFEAFRQLHEQILGNVQSACACGILRFLRNWNPLQWQENDVLSGSIEEILKGASNLVFRVDGMYPHEDPQIAAAWQSHYEQAEGETIQCLISGREDVLELVHPALKGVNGAQSSGAALVSFNAPAFCSFGREQGQNAPIGKKAAFAYTTALNHLLADKDSVQYIGDTAVVCWADGASPKYHDLALTALFGKEPPAELKEQDLRAAVKRLAQGLPCTELDLSPEKPFFILGVAPNAARLSVRFFLRSSFGELMQNVNAHHTRTEIVGSRYAYYPLWALLRETVNLNSRDKTPSPVMAGAVARAIFSGTRYPASLLQNVMLRIRAEHEITPGRAAIIKAYFLNNTDTHCPKEVLTVGLNESSTNIPYTIGRLFAVYEAVQEKANPGVNTTIKDKYFNSVSATPAHILPILNDLYRHHLRKLDPGQQIFFEKQVGALFNILDVDLPTRLTLPEQAAFQLGYYHQKQKRFEKKENKES